MKSSSSDRRRPLLEALPSEAQLMACCTRAGDLSDQQHARVHSLLEGEFDWEYVLYHARRHGIAPFLHRHLGALGNEKRIPEEVQTALQQEARSISFRNLQQTRELVRLLKQFADEELPVMPFKGPALAELVYGNPAYRQFLDLDLLVRRRDIGRVRERLRASGYHPHRDLTPAEEKEHIASGRGFEFVHGEKQVVVEVHWTFFFEIYAFELEPEDVWAREEWTEIAGVPVRTFAPEDLLLYLCAHGTKHRWMRLTWISDVAELVHARPDLDWEVVEERAAQMGLRRMLLLGLHLAGELLDAPVPKPLRQAAMRSRVVQSMARQVCTRWLFREPEAFKESPATVFWFHFKERERWRDRLPYTAHHVRLALEPTEQDRALVSLPEQLSFLYYLLRPYRMMWDRLAR